MNREEIKRLLQKAADELTPAEKERIDRWYKTIGKSADLSPFADAADEHKTRDDLRRSIEQKRNQHRGQAHGGKRFRWYQVAAAFLLIAGSVWIYRQQYNRPAEDQAALPNLQYTTVNAEAGIIKKVTLPDGSTVWLNGNSCMTVPEKFTDTVREVRLEGEAFFEVTRDSSRPFIVKAGSLSTLVLGTSFNIKAYPNLENVVVNVATGRVAVNHGGEALAELTMDQQLVFEKSTASHHTEPYNNRHANGWREGTIWLEGSSFEELSVLFTNTFEYTLETQLGRLHDVRFTASFRRQDKLTDILDMLCKIPGVDYRIEGRVITMY